MVGVWARANGSDSEFAPRGDTPVYDSSSFPSRDIPSEGSDESARDAALVARVRAGDAEAYETIYRTFHAPLIEFALHYVAGTEEAAELVSDVFATIWERRESWAPTGIARYLFGAVRNRALNAERDARRLGERHTRYYYEGISPAAGEPPPAPDAALEAASDRAAVRRAMQALTATQRQVLYLRWHRQMEWPGIAEVMGITPAAAQMHHSRALKALRALAYDYLR